MILRNDIITELKPKYLIGIEGAQNSGKTTILNLLKELFEKDKDFIFVKELVQFYLERNHLKGLYEIKDFQKFQLDLIKMHEFIIKNNFGKKIIFDRTLFSALVYSNFDTNVSNNVSKVLGKFSYDIIFLLEPIPQIEDNGLRDTNKKNQDAIYESYLKTLGNLDNVIHIKGGTTNERVNQILNYLLERNIL